MNKRDMEEQSKVYYKIIKQNSLTFLTNEMGNPCS